MRPLAMHPIQDMLRGAGRLFPASTTRPLHPRKAVLAPRRSLRRLRTAAILQSRVEPVSAPAAAGRAVVGGGVTDPTVEMAPPTNNEVVLDSADKPGMRDRANFNLHWSVDYWQNFTLPPAIEESSSAPIPSRLQAIVKTLSDAASTAGVFSSSKAAAYWSYHITRSGFFAIQGIAGVLAARAASTVTGRASEDTGIRIESIIKAGLTGPMAEALAMYYQDYRNVEQGVYALPWDMTTSGHRQWSPFWVAQRTAQFVSEASATLKRRTAGTAEDVWLKSNLYPDYYLNTFHFQTDGWLSEQSAKVYEVSTETLFLGRQDAMQRQTLVPLAKWMSGRPASGRGVRALEIAAGTGRFATFIKDNYPKMDLTLLDLSPYYLLEARKNIKYWAEKKAPGESLGGADGTGTSYLQAPAEAIPQPDASFDVVYSVYLFHELPPKIRRTTAAEMARVLRPGGVLVISDSIQLGDRERLDANLGRFGDFNEPFYRTYIAEDFGKMFKDVGLEPDMKVMASSSKTLSFHKPAAPSKPAAPTGKSAIAPVGSAPVEESFDEVTAGEQSAAQLGTVPAS